MNKKTISLQITIDLFENLRKSAFDHHMTVSKFIRFILESYYKNQQCMDISIK